MTPDPPPAALRLRVRVHSIGLPSRRSQTFGASRSGRLPANRVRYRRQAEWPLRLCSASWTSRPISEGSTGADALRNTLDLAQLADELGYHRYWVAEHHGDPMLASPSPEVLIGPIAAVTSRMRVGSGGVMLPHYSPLKVAENFSILARPVPRAASTSPRPRPGHRPADDLRAAARPPPGRARRLPHQLAELLGLLEDRLPSDHPFPRLAACPASRRPEPWLLGSSPQSGIWAARARPALRVRRLHQPGRRADRGPLPLAVRRHRAPGGAARRRRRLGHLRRDRRGGAAARRQRPMAFAMLRRGAPDQHPAAERRVRFLESEGHALDALPPGGARSSARRRPCARACDAVAEEYGADELMVVAITHDHGARRRSYELIAEACDLAAARPAEQIAS